MLLPVAVKCIKHPRLLSSPHLKDHKPATYLKPHTTSPAPSSQAPTYMSPPLPADSPKPRRHLNQRSDHQKSNRRRHHRRRRRSSKLKTDHESHGLKAETIPYDKSLAIMTGARGSSLDPPSIRKRNQVHNQTKEQLAPERLPSEQQDSAARRPSYDGLSLHTIPFEGGRRASVLSGDEDARPGVRNERQSVDEDEEERRVRERQRQRERNMLRDGSGKREVHWEQQNHRHQLPPGHEERLGDSEAKSRERQPEKQKKTTCFLPAVLRRLWTGNRTERKKVESGDERLVAEKKSAVSAAARREDQDRKKTRSAAKRQERKQ